MANQIPEKLINFRVYNDNQDLLGIADVTMPTISYMTDSVSGAGVAGEVDSPVMGHFQSMTVSMNWRTVNSALTGLVRFRGHALELRGAQQIYDSGTSEWRAQPLKVVLRAMPKSGNLGTLNVGVSAGATTEHEVVYLKVDVDDKTVLEIDKYNFICNIDGTDYLASVKSALGLS